MAEPDWKDDIEAIDKKLDQLKDRHERWKTPVTYLQTGIAVLTIATTAFGAWNHFKLEDIQQKQAQVQMLVQNQMMEANLATTVLHEAMSILDTEREEVRRAKTQAYVQLIIALQARIRESDNVGNEFAARYYSSLLATFQLDQQDSKTAELLRYDQAEQGVRTRTRASQFVAPAPASPALDPAPVPGPATAASAPVGDGGEASSPGPSSGWDYDVFWCSRNVPGGTTTDPVTSKPSKNYQTAALLFQQLVARRGTGRSVGRVRLRRLPEILNQTIDYAIPSSAVVVRSYASQIKQDEEFRSWVAGVLASGGPGANKADVIIQERQQKLRYYSTVFACMD